MKYFWHANVFVRLLIPFLAGILLVLSGFIGAGTVRLWMLILGIIAYYLHINFFDRYVTYSTTWQYAVLPLILFFLLGAYVTGRSIQRAKPNDKYEKLLGKRAFYVAKLSSPVKETPKTYKFFCEIVPEGDSLVSPAKVLVFLHKDSLHQQLPEWGHLFAFEGVLKKFKAGRNPGAFDYSRYLRDRYVFYQTYIQSKYLLLPGKYHTHSLVDAGLFIREKLFSILKKYIPDKNAVAIASAILLGYDEMLEANVKQVFAAAGAMHVLCVSGLHVGILYLLFNYLLFFLNTSKRRRLVKNWILIFLIASYAVITGLSPSVMRASLMLIVIIFGRMQERKISIYNLLAFSAFILLLVNPFLIREIGFQLSYMAVLGIVIVFPRLRPLFISRYWLFNQVWALSLVSFSAVLFTFPLAMYYFHQFPMYFFVSNLLVIPAATIIIYAGVVLFITSRFVWLASFTGKLMSVFIRFVFGALHVLVELPGAVWSRISIPPAMIFLLYFILFFLIAFFLYQKIRVLLPLSVLLFIMVLTLTYRNYQSLTQHKMVIYEDSKHAMADIIDGRQAFFVGDSSLFASDQVQRYLLYPMETKFGIRHHKPVSFRRKTSGNYYVDFPYMLLGEHVVYHWSSQYESPQDGGLPIPVDYLWVSKIHNLSLIKYLPLIHPKCIVIEADVSKKYQKAIKKAAKSMNIELYSIGERGCWVLNY